MNYIYPITQFELAIISLSTSILFIAIIINIYTYSKLKEKIQLYMLFINLVMFGGTMVSTITLSLTVMDFDIETILRISSLGQVIISYIGLAWLMYTEEALAHNKVIKPILYIAKLSTIPVLITVTISSFILPDLFLSIETPIWTALEGIKESDLTRGKNGILYVIRDTYTSAIAGVILFSFFHEIIINKRKKGNIIFLVSLILFILASMDETQVVYTGKNLLFGGTVFPRAVAAAGFFGLVVIYLSVERFITATFNIDRTKGILLDISKQHKNIFSNSVSMSNSIVNVKHNIKSVISNFYNLSSSILRNINKLKSSIVKSIEYSKKFEISNNEQRNAISINVTQLKKIENNFLSMEAALETQKKGITKTSNYLEKSITTMYNLQSRAKNLTEYSLVFKNKTIETKDKIHDSTNQIESFLQISTQIRRIIIFINNLYDKAKILAINSGIQASKSENWSENFSIVSKEISELVQEILTVTKKLEVLLSNIDTTFKDFYFTKNNILSNFNTLVGDTDLIESNIKKVSEDIYLQNDYNTHSLKNISKLLSINKNTKEFLLKEKDFSKTTETMLLHLNDILISTENRSSEQADALKNLLSDMNKILATSNDLKSACSKFNDNLENFDSVVTNLKNKTLEYK